MEKTSSVGISDLINIGSAGNASESQLNYLIRGELGEHVLRPYQLDAHGQKMVTEANAQVVASYAVTNQFRRPKAFFDYQFARLAKAMPLPVTTAMDLGCGLGALGRELVSRGLAKHCFSVDSNPEAIAHLEAKLKLEAAPTMTPVLADLTRLEWKNEKVDLVIGNSFFHQLADNRQALKNILTFLKPGGVLFLTSEPSVNAAMLENPISFLVAKLRARKATTMTNVWTYSDKALTAMLEELGFENIEIRGHGFLSSLANYTFLTVWTKLLRLPVPAPVWSVLFKMMYLERRMFSFLPTNWFCGLGVIAKAK